MENFYHLSDETKEIFFEVFKKKSFPVNIKFQFEGNKKQKELIKISIIPSKYSFLLEKELLVSINEDILDAFDDESVTILFEQEIDKIHINIETGKIKMVKPDLTTFSSLINKYGVDKVARANKIEELYQQQVKDRQDSEEFIA
jgi:hypothetical protein